MLKGIDISNYQKNIDYSSLKRQGINAAYLKASEGLSYKDPMMDVHYKGLKAQGVMVGFYHFFRAKDIQNSIEQADFFVESTKNHKPDLKFACDVETTEGLEKEILSRCVKTFVGRVKELTGIECIVYTGSSFSKSNLTDTLKYTKLWLAHYSASPSWNTDIWPSWSGWQYSSNGTIDGIAGDVDVDLFREELLVGPNSQQDYCGSDTSKEVPDINAVVENDWFYTRDEFGNQEEGHRVDVNDKIKVIDVSYSKQLNLIKYPILSGMRTAYIRNVPNNIRYLYQNDWQNGSTIEPVYQDSTCSIQIGLIDPHEFATPLYRENNILCVVYNTDKGQNSKSGFVRYNGGFTMF